MRKLLFPALVLMTLNVFGQAATPTTAPTAPPSNPYGQMDRPDFIVAVQMGTDTLKEGEVKVKVAEATLMEMKEAMASPDYVVMLTPRGHCGQLNLVETNEKGFLVRQNGTTSSHGIFDYVVYVKQKRPMMPMRQRPAMHPPTPAAGQQPATPTAPAPPQKQ